MGSNRFCVGSSYGIWFCLLVGVYAGDVLAEDVYTPLLCPFTSGLPGGWDSFVYERKGRGMMADFQVGDSVQAYFVSLGRKKVGKVIQVNAKTLVVRFDEYPPSTLTIKKYKCTLMPRSSA